jgi:hypothetical protein
VALIAQGYRELVFLLDQVCDRRNRPSTARLFQRSRPRCCINAFMTVVNLDEFVTCTVEMRRRLSSPISCIAMTLLPVPGPPSTNTRCLSPSSLGGEIENLVVGEALIVKQHPGRLLLHCASHVRE